MKHTMKRVLAAGALLAATTAFQPGEARAQAACPTGMIPLFEGVDKPAAAPQAGQTPADAARAEIEAGWREFNQNRNAKAALLRFNQAWLLDPENGDAYYGLGAMSTVLSRYREFSACPYGPEQSVKLFEQAIAKPATGADAFVNYADYLGYLGRHDDSVRVLTHALDKDPNTQGVRAGLAQAHYRKRDYAQACDWATQAKAAGERMKNGLRVHACSMAKKAAKKK